MRPLHLLLPWLFLVTACGGSGQEGGEGGQAGAPSTSNPDPCCTIGAICHVTGETTDQTVSECHILGHRGVQEDCAAAYDSCLLACEGLNPHPVEHACE